jgi:hypothetical protein
MRSTTAIETPDAGVYLKQLCRHFGHRVENVVGSHLERFGFREELRVTWPEAS